MSEIPPPACESCGLIVPREFRVQVRNERAMNPRQKVIDREWGSVAIDGTRDRWLCRECVAKKW